MPEFSRQEVIALTGIQPAHLSYASARSLIVPSRNGKHGRSAIVTYSIEQVLEVVAFKRLRDRVPAWAMEKILQFIREYDHSPGAFDINFALIDYQLVPIEDIGGFGGIVILTAKSNGGQCSVRFVDKIGDAWGELRQSAQERKILGLEQRVQGTKLAAIAL